MHIIGCDRMESERVDKLGSSEREERKKFEWKWRKGWHWWDVDGFLNSFQYRRLNIWFVVFVSEVITISAQSKNNLIFFKKCQSNFWFFKDSSHPFYKFQLLAKIINNFKNSINFLHFSLSHSNDKRSCNRYFARKLAARFFNRTIISLLQIIIGSRHYLMINPPHPSSSSLEYHFPQKKEESY